MKHFKTSYKVNKIADFEKVSNSIKIRVIYSKVDI
jgi:hypothetical protein